MTPFAGLALTALGICFAVSVAIYVSGSPWWLFGLLFLAMLSAKETKT